MRRILFAILMTWGMISSADPIELAGPNRSDGATPTSHEPADPTDDAIKSCLAQPAPTLPQGRQLSTTLNGSTVASPTTSRRDSALLKQIKNETVQSLKHLASDNCSGFDGKLAEQSKSLRAALICQQTSLNSPSKADYAGWKINTRTNEATTSVPDLKCINENQGPDSVATPDEQKEACDNALKQSQGRVQSMAEIGQELHDNLDRVGARASEYLRTNYYDRTDKALRKLNEERKKKCQETADQLYSENPLLKHIDVRNVSGDLNNARKKCADSALQSSDALASLPTDSTSNQSLALLNLSPIANRILRNHPEMCDSYRRLRQTLLDRQSASRTLNDVLGVGSLLGCGAATVFGTPALGTACFLASGALSAGNHTISAMRNTQLAGVAHQAEGAGVSPAIARELSKDATDSTMRAAVDVATSGAFASITRAAQTTGASERLAASVAGTTLSQKTARSAAETLAKARQVLRDDNLKENVEDAIVRAHNVGLKTAGKEKSPFTLAEIREKNKILTEAGLTPQQIRELMKEEVVGDPVRVAAGRAIREERAAAEFSRTPAYAQFENDVLIMTDRNLDGHQSSEFNMLFDKFGMAKNNQERMAAAQEMRAFRQSIEDNTYVPIFQRQARVATEVKKADRSNVVDLDPYRLRPGHLQPASRVKSDLKALPNHVDERYRKFLDLTSEGRASLQALRDGGWRLESLRQGGYSVRLNDGYRIVFEVVGERIQVTCIAVRCYSH